MSIRALKLGVESRLRSALNANETTVGIQPNGQPPPAAGQHYVSIFGGGWQTVGNEPSGDDRAYSLSLCLTYKMAYAPQDRRGAQAALAGQEYLDDLADQVTGYLLNDWTTMGLVNGFITGAGSSTNGFCEAFQSASCGPIEEKGPDWVWAEEAKHPPSVFCYTLTLRGARRIRLLETIG